MTPPEASVKATVRGFSPLVGVALKAELGGGGGESVTVIQSGQVAVLDSPLLCPLRCMCVMDS